MPITVNCLNNRGRSNPLKTSTITELPGKENGLRRFRVVTLEYVSNVAKELNHGQTRTAIYYFDGSVFVIFPDDSRIASVQDCKENGLSQLPEFNETAQRERYTAETEKFLEEYRRANANRDHTAEELFEMRSAFGPGEIVVNVITGKRTTL